MPFCMVLPPYRRERYELLHVAPIGSADFALARNIRSRRAAGAGISAHSARSAEQYEPALGSADTRPPGGCRIDRSRSGNWVAGAHLSPGGPGPVLRGDSYRRDGDPGHDYRYRDLPTRDEHTDQQ